MTIKKMTKGDEPESFGVFKPVGHVVLAFAETHDRDEAARALAEAGFADSDVLRYSPDEMCAMVDREMAQSGPLAALGQEKNLAKAHRELSEQGHCWLVVYAPHAEQAERVGQVAKRCHAKLAQKYNQMTIEELV